MRRILFQLACATALASAVVHAQPPVKEGAAEKEVRPPMKSIAARAAEANAVAQRHCSNDAAPADVQAKPAPAARDALVRVPAQQKAALKQALPPGRWSPASVSADKVREKAKVPPELDRGL